IPTPPLVKLMAPVCQNSAPMKLFGYPFGGTWSGPGLVQGSNGTFDPNLVGPGKFLLTYKTPNCTYEGKLLIEVLKKPGATLSSPPSLIICPTNPQMISINPLDSATYQWYFQSPNGSLTKLSGKASISLSVNLAGSYYCVITKGQCSAQSPAVVVTYETPSASIGPQKVICDINKTITLTASPSGGSWSGGNITDQTNGVFNPSGLANGKYPVKYTFTSNLGCTYSFADTVLVDTIPKVRLNRVPGDFCLSGLVNLQVVPPVHGAKFLWNYKSTSSSAWLLIDSVSSPSRTFVDRGYYESIVSNKYCKTKTDSLLIGDLNDINLTLNPNDSLIKVCFDRTTELRASSTRTDVTFSWYKKDTIQNNYQLISSDQSLIVDRSGYYKVKAVIGFCESESALKKVKFLPKDTLFVPNVFTPDGDGFNPDFSIVSNANNYSIEILNRWGEVIYKGDKNSSPWDGGNHPTGVYFWNVEYKDCRNDERKAKGWVQLIR
ncbi:MAG TPA: hypothetical protein DGG95_00205, partial [Cytophagales bacterium]|nr:hypothetical protein [Cytophagales bacterium]